MESDRFGPDLKAQFKILGKLGEGGMSEVYLAEQFTLGRKVALKFLAASSFPEKESLERFRREGRALATLSHENILAIYGTGVDMGRPYLVLEYMPGETLREALCRLKKFPARQAAEIVYRVAAAIELSHRHGVVHRDLKPENVLLGPDGMVKVFDFGLAKLVQAGGADMNLTEKGIILGTPSYIAPEQVTGTPPNESTDIYGVGALLYELVSGTAPHGEGYDIKFLRRKVKEDPPPLTTRVDGCPDELNKIAMCCLERKVRARYGSMEDLVDALAAFLGFPVRRRRRLQISRWLQGVAPRLPRIALAGLAAASVAVAAFITLRSRGPDVSAVEVQESLTALVVTWHSESAYRGRATVLRSVGSAPLMQLDEPEPTQRHRLVLRDLEPNHTYLVGIGDQERNFNYQGSRTLADIGVPPELKIREASGVDMGDVELIFAAPVMVEMRPASGPVTVMRMTQDTHPETVHHFRLDGPGVVLGGLSYLIEVTDIAGVSSKHQLRGTGWIQELETLLERPVVAMLPEKLKERRTLEPLESQLLVELGELIGKRREVLRSVLSRPNVPLAVRHSLYRALVGVELLERASPRGPASNLRIGDLVREFAHATGSTASDENFVPEGSQLLLSRDGTKNNMLLTGMSREDGRKLLKNLFDQEDELETAVLFEAEVEGPPRPRTVVLGIMSRCMGSTRFFDVEIDRERTIRLWGSGDSLPVDKMLSLDSTQSMPLQVLEVELPGELLPPGRVSFKITAYPIGRTGNDSCVPALNKLWVRYP